MAGLLGPVLVLTFCLSQALRDVYFGHLFQGIDFFAVILIAFTLSTLVFGTIVAVRSPAQLRALRAHATSVLAMNVTTALAWTCYFFALSHLEPAIVNTVHSGMGPLTVLALAACGARLAKPSAVERAELCAYAGIALSIVALWWVVFAGRSGLPGSFATNLAGLALVMVSGSSITVSLLYSKRLHDHGASAETVTAARYLLLILLAACVEIGNGGLVALGVADVATVAAAASALIVLPLFVLQIGIAQTAPLTAQVVRSLGPVCVFAVEQLDGRLTYSTTTLVCILLYSGAAIASNLAHGWRERPALAV